LKLGLSLLAFRPGRIGGAETYVRKLLAELPRAARASERLLVFLDRDVAASLETPGWDRVVVDRSASGLVAERLLEAFTPYRARAVERAIAKAAPDAVLFPQQSIFPRRVACASVLTVHDLLHLGMPDVVPRAERAFRAAAYPESLARARRIIAISEATRAALLEAARVEPAKVTVVRQGFDPAPGALPGPAGFAGPYLYFPAATFAHKGHESLIRSYAALRRRGELAARLVFSGMRTPLWRRLARLAEELGVAQDVVHVGFVPYAEVRALFAGAEAVLFPSRHEGFGLPVLEAAAQGKKIVTSRLPVFDELGVPQERQIDFGDPDALARALRLEGPTLLERAPATWAECAARTLDVMRAAAAGCGS
jgi:glycosyltransferase involved in cell wall biosynthesis